MDTKNEGGAGQITAAEVDAANKRIAKRHRREHPGPLPEELACKHPRTRRYADKSGRYCVDCFVDQKDFFQ